MIQVRNVARMWCLFKQRLGLGRNITRSLGTLLLPPLRLKLKPMGKDPEY